MERPNHKVGDLVYDTESKLLGQITKIDHVRREAMFPYYVEWSTTMSQPTWFLKTQYYSDFAIQAMKEDLKQILNKEQ